MVRSNKWQAVLTAWALVCVCALVGCSSAPHAGGESEKPAEEAAAEPEVKEDAAEAEPEAEPPAPTQEERRTELALSFARTWHTTIMPDPDNEFVWYDLDEWYGSCVAFVAPGSTLMEQFEGSAVGSFMGPGTKESPTVATSVELVSAEGDSYTVRVVYATANEFVSGWQDQTVETVETYTFDGADKLVRIQTEYADWG